MSRSFAETMGFDWPPNVAAVVDGEPVTWDQVMANRRARQAQQLADKRHAAPSPVVPCYVWTFKVPGWLYGGWHCYIVTLHEQIGVTFRNPFGGDIALSIMEAEPLGLMPMAINFTRWMQALARRRPRHHPRDPRPAGSLIGWYDRVARRFALTREALAEAD